MSNHRGAFIKFYQFSSHIKLKKPTKFLKCYNISSSSSSFSSSIRLNEEAASTMSSPKAQTCINMFFPGKGNSRMFQINAPPPPKKKGRLFGTLE